MKNKNSTFRFHSDPQFNMTPMIDVVFLLIIFFMLICQFIVQENYKLVVPDDCAQATASEQLDRNAITVSVFPNASAPDQPIYAVRSQMFDPADPKYTGKSDQLLADIAQSIAQQSLSRDNPMVLLRADRNMGYGQVQNALIALSHAGITKVQLAAYRTNQDK